MTMNEAANRKIVKVPKNETGISRKLLFVDKVFLAKKDARANEKTGKPVELSKDSTPKPVEIFRR